MKKNKRLTILGVVIINILILFSLTPLILAIPQKGYFQVRKASFENLQNLRNEFTFGFEEIYFNSDVRRTVDIWGYAYFAPSPSEITNKKIVLIFSSPKTTYFVDTDLADIFYHKPQLLEAKISGSIHGFRTTFSPLGMKDGTYDLYIYLFENADYVGYVKTDKVFTKHLGKFTQGKSAASP